MDSKNELQHHGILGMKWGKRNGPPYPLSGSQKSSAEKKAASGQKASSSRATDAYKTRAEKRAEYFRELNRQKKVAKNLKTEPEKSRKMTADELRSAIARLELEKKYAELKVNSAKKQKKELSRAQKLLQDILYDSTKNIGTQAVTRFMGEQLNELIGKMFKEYQTEEYVNPKKGQKDK